MGGKRMSDKSKIEWTDATWNPVTGCSKVSEGCRNCYAQTFAERFRGTPGHYFENGFDITLRPDKLDQPLKWKKPRRIFVNSMSDLFHEDVPFDFIDRVFVVMSLAEHHTFQILTKRPSRMKEYLSKNRLKHIGLNEWPLLNIWLGVSVENQKAADERIPLLLQTPSAVRFLSCEPLLGPVNLSMRTDRFEMVPGIDLVIVGGESGYNARPMHPDWAMSIRDQCQAAGVAFFFKQWGEWAPVLNPEPHAAAKAFNKVGKKKAGRLLDGREWNEMPR